MKKLIYALRLGASISRERNLNLDYAIVADQSADAIERLENEAVAATLRIENDSKTIKGLERKLLNARRKFSVFSEVAAMENLYEVGLEQEHEITALEKERDFAVKAMDRMQTERDALASEVDRARNDERTAMSYLSEARKALGVDCDFPSMIGLISALKVERDALRAELDKLKQQEPVAWINTYGNATMLSIHAPDDDRGTVKEHWHPLYAAGVKP